MIKSWGIMENEKSLYEMLNEAAALNEEQEKVIKANAIKRANEIFKEITQEKED